MTLSSIVPAARTVMTPVSNGNLRHFQVLQEGGNWTKIKPPDGLDEEELYKSLKEYKDLVFEKSKDREGACSFSVKRENGYIEIEQRGLFGWLNFGTKDHPYTIVFQPKMMYGFDLTKNTDLGKFSQCLFNMKVISEGRNSIKDKRKRFVEKALSQGIKEAEFKLELLEEIFTSRLEEALSEGVARQYVRRTTSYPYLKGKIIPSQLIPDIWMHSGYLKQEVQELSPNIPVNQLLAWCCAHLLDGKLGNKLEQRLTVLSQRFKRVEIWGRPNESSLESLETLPAIHSHLQGAVDIALMIARDEMSLLNRDGSAKASGLVIDANYAFEDFVACIFERVAPNALTTDKDTGLSYGFSKSNNKLKDKPDIYIPVFGEDGATIKMTFDAKHSGKKGESFGRDYRNQTITAAWSRDCQVCGLVFPQGNKEEHFNVWNLSNNTSAPNCYSQISLDPSSLWKENTIATQAENLEKQLWKLYYYNQVETALRDTTSLSQGWEGRRDASFFNDELEQIRLDFDSRINEEKDCKDVYEQLRKLEIRFP